jgi:spermidine synthase
MSLSDDAWFTEIHPDQGSAFSLELGPAGKLHEAQSPFQRVSVYQSAQWGNLMAIDGLFMLSTRDNFLYHEMMAHPALFTHAKPQRVLIIGGGDCGTLREVLRHPEIHHVEQVDIDEEVTKAALIYFPELCESNSDPRAHLYFDDGIRWLREAADASYDVIIVDSTDPVGPAEGLFGEPFLRDALRALTPGGIFVQQSESPLLHLDLIVDLHRFQRRVGFKDVRTLHFPQPVYPGGWWSCTMARKGALIEGFRESDAANRPFKTRYYSPEIHLGALALPPFLAEAIASAGS